MSDESGTYGDGWNFCRERGGVLASVRSQEEQDFVAGEKECDKPELILPRDTWLNREMKVSLNACLTLCCLSPAARRSPAGLRVDRAE